MSRLAHMRGKVEGSKTSTESAVQSSTPRFESLVPPTAAKVSKQKSKEKLFPITYSCSVLLIIQ
jgi:hypothetical protein